MNTQTTKLPDLDDGRIAAIERDVFARIAEDRRAAQRRRTRGWTIAASAAVVVIVAAVIAPSVTSSVDGVSDAAGGMAFPADAQAVPDSAIESRSFGAVPEAASSDATGQREVITTGSATVVAEDVAAAAATVARQAQERGGYVASLSVGSQGADAVIAPYPYPAAGDGDAWIDVRIPAEQLEAALADLREVGEVTSSTVSRQDVTDQAIDLRARIASAEASVTRLTELMTQAASVGDLIAAESALAERQAALEADRQQLAWLEGQIELSSLTVHVTPRAEPVAADPAGFGDGVAAGWNGLVASLNALVIAVGFLLPWLGVLAVIGAIVWAVVHIIHRARRDRAAHGESTE